MQIKVFCLTNFNNQFFSLTTSTSSVLNEQKIEIDFHGFGM